MAVTIASLAAKLSLDNRGFIAGFAQSAKVASGFGAKISSGLTSVVSNIGATVAASVTLGAAIAKLGSEMQSIDREAKLADRLGITFESMQKLSLAASLAGADVEVLAKGMLMMGRNIGSGGKALDVRFFEVADSIAAIEDPAERAKKAMEIFGKSGLELLNVLQTRGRGLRQSAEAIDRLGLGISRVDAGKVEAANDSLEVLGAVLSGIARKVAVEAAPTIERFALESVKAIENITNALDSLNARWDQLGGFIAGVYDSLRKISGLGFFAGPSSPTAPGSGASSGNLFGDAAGGINKALRNPMAADRGSIEAARIIQGSSQANAMPRLLEAMLAELKVINRNSDPIAAEARGVPSLQVAVI